MASTQSAAYRGEDRWAAGGETTVVETAPEGSLEAQLHASRHAYAFVDFRALDGDRRHPLRRPQMVRVPKYQSVAVPDVGRIYDGLIYIDQMSPARPIPT